MKKVLSYIFSFLSFIYLVLAVFSTICLLKKNEYGYPQFNDKTLIVIDEKSSYFDSGDLIVLKKPNNNDVNINDPVFFYDTDFRKNTINIANVINKDVINENETTFYVNGKSFSSSSLIGKVTDSVKYPFIGKVLNVLTSRWGFFFIIIVPFFILFIIELFVIYTEIRYGSKKK